MSGWEMKIIAAEARRLVALAAEDDDLRTDLRRLAREILAATEVPEPPAVGETAAGPMEALPTESPTLDPEPTAPGAGFPDHDGTEERPADRLPEREPLRELMLGWRPSAPTREPDPLLASAGAQEGQADLERIQARCRSKAVAARWAADRQRQSREGTDVVHVDEAPKDPDVAEWADRLTDDYYWRSAQEAAVPLALSLLEDLGGCYEAVAVALSLVAESERRRGALEPALLLLAEAQSMLRRALQRLHAPEDADQLAVHEEVREAAARHRVYLKRYMRADDLADPTRWPQLLARIESLTASALLTQKHSERIARIRKPLKNLREGQVTEHDWQALIQAVDAMVGEGVPPGHRELRELLLPVVDTLPDRDDLPNGFRLVLGEIDRYLATAVTHREPTHATEPTAEVKEAARLLRGRGLVLIGGVRPPGALNALKAGLELAELVWIETKEHQSVKSFEPAIARPDVAVVVLAIRWSSHAFGDVKLYCDRHGKPLVRLPGGYGLHQVAAQILDQCSGQLGERHGV